MNVYLLLVLFVSYFISPVVAAKERGINPANVEEYRDLWLCMNGQKSFTREPSPTAPPVTFMHVGAYRCYRRPVLKTVGSGLWTRVKRAKTRVTMTSALSMIDAYRMQGCVARVVCEVSCDPNGFGALGKQAHSLLFKFGQESVSEAFSRKLVPYREAAKRGIKLRPNCKICARTYPRCARNTPGLLKLISTFDIV